MKGSINPLTGEAGDAQGFGDCNICGYWSGAYGKTKGCKIPGGYGKCTRPAGHCKPHKPKGGIRITPPEPAKLSDYVPQPEPEPKTYWFTPLLEEWEQERQNADYALKDDIICQGMNAYFSCGLSLDYGKLDKLFAPTNNDGRTLWPMPYHIEVLGTRLTDMQALLAEMEDCHSREIERLKKEHRAKLKEYADLERDVERLRKCGLLGMDGKLTLDKVHNGDLLVEINDAFQKAAQDINRRPDVPDKRRTSAVIDMEPYKKKDGSPSAMVTIAYRVTCAFPPADGDTVGYLDKNGNLVADPVPAEQLMLPETGKTRNGKNGR